MIEPTFKFDPSRRILSRFRNTTENDILRIFVFSRNQKGRSQGAFITEFHLGNYKKQVSDLMEQAARPSPVVLGLFFTLLLIGLTIIARLYWKSRLIKKNSVKEDKYNMESRCSLLKQDTFAVSVKIVSSDLKLKNRFISFCPHLSRMPFRVRNSSRRERASRREGKLRLLTMSKTRISSHTTLASPASTKKN